MVLQTTHKGLTMTIVLIITFALALLSTFALMFNLMNFIIRAIKNEEAQTSLMTVVVTIASWTTFYALSIV